MNKKAISKKIYYHLIIALVLGIPFMLPLMHALTGNYSATSPFSCGSNCSGGYELSGNDATYCYNNAEDCYNTIDGCRDGSDPEYEFVNNIWVTSLNGSNFTGGYRINITVEFDCDTDGDTITISYNNGTRFRPMQDDTCSISALKNKSYDFVLDDIDGNHTVRATIVYQGGTQMTCGYDYDTSFSDTDDVTFYVYFSPDTDNPTVTGISPGAGTSYNQSYGLVIPISANVTDNYNVSSVQAFVEWNTFNNTINLSYVSGNLYTGNFTNTTDITTYNVTILANDTSKNQNNTVTTNFEIITSNTINITSPTNRQVWAFGPVNLSFSISNTFNVHTAMYSIDSGTNVTVTKKEELSFVLPDQQAVIGEADTNYANISMSFITNENISTEIVAAKLKRNGSGTTSSQLQIRTDSSDQPSNTILAYGNISNSSVSTNYSFVNITLNQTVNLTNNTKYWLFLAPNGSNTDFYTWEASNDGLYADGNYSNNNSLDLLFKVYKKYKYNTSITGISKGTHTIIVYANSTNQNTSISSSVIQFDIDNTAPSINTISYAPNITNSLDPGTTINVSANITDALAITNVVLQYKQINESNFTNKTMDNSTGLYKANFTANVSNNWTFRVFAIDNSNNSVYSSNTTVNVSYEYIWNRTPGQFNTTSGVLDQNITVGNLIINNSNSDINLTINISKTASTVPDVYFNNTLGSLIFNVTSGSISTIIVNVTAQSLESEQPIRLKIDPSQANADPDFLYTNFTFVSYTSGPYLNIDITAYDATVTQGQERVKLTSTIVNAGNESASNVTANWTLPTGWTSKTNTSQTYTSLAVGQEVSFSRFINLDSNATTGNQTIQIDVNCSEGKEDSDSKTVTVSSSSESTPPTTIVVSGGGGGGGGLIPLPKVPKLNITISDELDNEIELIEIERGESATLKGILENTGETELKNISIILDNFPMIHYEIKPDTLKKIEINKSKKFTLTINIPEYFGSGKHKTSLVVTAMPDDSSGETQFSKDITIIVVTEDKANAAECFETARKEIEKLQQKEIKTDKLSQSLEQAEQSFENKDYSNANNICEKILTDAELAINVKEQMNAVDKAYSKLENEEKVIPELSELIQLMHEAFEREEFELTSRRAEQASMLLNLKEKEVQQTFAYRWDAFKQYWYWVIAGIVLAAIIGIVIYTSSSLGMVTRRIQALQDHEEIVNDKIKQVQKKYYIERIIPLRIYEKEMEHHRNAMAEIETKRTHLKFEKLKLLKRHTIEELEKAKHEAQKGKEDLQRKYFIDKSIDKKTFRKLTLGFERIIDDVESRIQMKKKS